MRYYILLGLVLLTIAAISGQALASDTSSLETAIINQVSDPTTTQNCGSSLTNNFIAVSTTNTYVLVIGGSAASGTNYQILVNTNASTQFQISRAGDISSIQAGATAHLLYHENLTISGESSFWAAIRYIPNANGAISIGVDDGGGAARYISPFTLTGTQGFVGTLTKTGTTCTSLPVGHLFNEGTAQFYQVLVTLQQCDSLVIPSDNDYTGCPAAERRQYLSSATINMTGNTSANALTNSSGVASFVSQTDHGLVQLYPIKSGYKALPYLIDIHSLYNVQNNASLTLWMQRSQLTIEQRETTFVVPAPAVHYINKTQPQTYYWSIFKVENATGVPTLRAGPYPVNNPAETTRYPISGPTVNTAGLANHTGQYFITATDRNATIIDVTSFVICSTSTTCQAQPNAPIAAFNLSMSQQILSALIPVLDAQQQQSNEQDTRGHILQVVDWAYGGPLCADEDSCLMPNMYLFLLACIFAMLLVMAVRRYG